MKNTNLKIMFVLIILFAIGCKQSEELTKNVPNRTAVRRIAISEAKTWYLGISKKKSTSGKKMSINTTSSNSEVSPIGDPNWNVSAVYNLADTIVIIKVPLTNYIVDHSYSPSMNQFGYRELIFQKDGSGEVKANVLEVHPDLTYLQQRQQSYPTATLQDYAILVKTEDFTGFVLTFDLNNNMLSGQHKTDGLTDKYLTN